MPELRSVRSIHSALVARLRSTLQRTPRIATFLAIASALGAPSLQAQTAVGSSSAQQTATVTLSAAGTLSTISVLTQGSPSQDFAFVSGGTCAAGTAYTAGQTCTVKYTFSPKGPGLRLGGIQLTSSAPAVLGSALISGTGTGPLLSFPTNQTPVKLVNDPYQYSALSSVAVTAAGAVYELTGYEILGYSSAGVEQVTDGLSDRASAMAIDGAGNLYLTFSSSIVEVLAVNGAVPNGTQVVRTLVSGLSSPYAITVDALGNVYFSDNGKGTVSEIVAVNGSIPVSNPTVRTLLTGQSQIYALAVDASGDLFYSGYSAGVSELVASGGTIPASPTVRAIGSGWSGPGGLAVDAAGNLYVADQSGLKEVIAVGGVIPTTNPTVLSLTSTALTALSLDGKGHLYYVAAYPQSANSYSLNLGTAPAVSFNSTALGSTSTDSPRTLTLQNIGNATLSFTSGTALSGASYSLPGGSTCPAGTSGTLAAGVTCATVVSFAPKALGANTGSLAVGSNSQNVTGTQTLALTGTGVADVATFGTMTVTPATLVTTTSQTVTISDTVSYNGAKPTGAVKFTLNAVAYTATCTGTSTPLTCAATVPAATVAGLAAGTYSITSSLAADTVYSATTGDTGTLTVQPKAPTLSTPAISPVSSVVYSTSQALTFTSTETYAAGAPTGAVTFSFNNVNYPATCTGSASPLTCTANVPASVVSTLDGGSYPVTANFAADATYTASSSASSTFSVTTSAPTMSAISFSPSTWVYGNAPALTVSTTLTFAGPVPANIDTNLYLVNSSYDAVCTASGAHTALCSYTAPTSFTSTLSAGSFFYVGFGYAGDNNYSYVSTTDTSTLVITQGTKSITFPQPAAGTVGATATLTATATGGEAVTYSIVSGNATVTGSNTVKYTGGGPVVIAADSAADTNYTAATQVTRTVIVAPGTTTLVMTAPTNTTYGSSSTLKATLTFPGSVLPTGAVTFTLNGTTAVAATCTGSASPLTCTANSPTATNAGSNSVVASYAGDSAYNGSTATATTLTVYRATLTITTTAQSYTYGDATVTLVAAGSFPANGANPTKVQFLDPSGAVFAGTPSCVTVSSGKFSCTQAVPASTYVTGTTYTITATFPQDTNYYAAGTQSVGSLVIARQTPVVTVVPATEMYGYTVANLTINVAFAGTRTPPAGAVSVSVGGLATRTATCTGTTSPLVCTIAYPVNASSASGTNFSVTTSIAQDANFSGVYAYGTITVVNQQPTLVASSTTIAQGAASTTLSALESWVGNLVPTGAVTLALNGQSATATCATVNSTSRTCSATFNTAALGIGTYSVVATQAAASSFDAASSTGTLTVTGSSTLTLNAVQPSNGGVQLTASIGTVPSTYAGGTVSFFDAGTAVCSNVALTNATAICVTPTLSSGTHSFTAVYTGDAVYAGSNSNASPIVITIDPATNTGNGSTAPGAQSAPVPVTLGFGGNVTLGAITLTNSGSSSAFTIVAGGTCSVGAAYTSGQNCTVNVVFTNPGTGLLLGTLALTDNKTPANVVGTATISSLGAR